MEAKPFVEITLRGHALHTTLTHGPSGVNLETDAPRDNGGEGASFSPTDLCASSLAACAVTTMALVAKRENIPWGDASARVEKHMTAAPRRIGKLVVEIQMPKELPVEKRPHFEQVAHTCPVARSLHPDIELDFRFNY
jgi:uncharacterized OsmC-like protein